MTGAFEAERCGGTVLEWLCQQREQGFGGRLKQLSQVASLHPARRRGQTLQSSSQPSLQAEDLLS